FVLRGSNHRRRTVACGLDADPAAEVDVDVPVSILDERTFRERDVDGKGNLHGVRDELLLPRHRGLRLRPRWDRDDLRSAEILLAASRHGIVARAKRWNARAQSRKRRDGIIGFP